MSTAQISPIAALFNDAFDGVGGPVPGLLGPLATYAYVPILTVGSFNGLRLRAATGAPATPLLRSVPADDAQTRWEDLLADVYATVQPGGVFLPQLSTPQVRRGNEKRNIRKFRIGHSYSAFRTSFRDAFALKNNFGSVIISTPQN